MVFCEFSNQRLSIIRKKSKKLCVKQKTVDRE